MHVIQTRPRLQLHTVHTLPPTSRSHYPPALSQHPFPRTSYREMLEGCGVLASLPRRKGSQDSHSPALPAICGLAGAGGLPQTPMLPRRVSLYLNNHQVKAKATLVFYVNLNPT